MSQHGMNRRRQETGFTLIELMIVVMIISMASAIAIPVLKDATTKAHRNAAIADGTRLHDAFTAYYLDEGQFPSEWGPGGLDRGTLEPLTTEGYFPIAAPFLGKLAGGRLLLYLAPDVETPNSQYIAIMRAAYDPNVIMVVAHTGIISSAGHFLDGVYLIDDGTLQEADELN
jgi:prepilin-type N-terminal cleavage/methylation domain-containing protein